MNLARDGSAGQIDYRQGICDRQADIGCAAVGRKSDAARIRAARHGDGSGECERSICAHRPIIQLITRTRDIDVGSIRRNRNAVHGGAVTGICRRSQQPPGRNIDHQQIVHVFYKRRLPIRGKRQIHRPTGELKLLTGGSQDLFAWERLHRVRQLADFDIGLEFFHPIKRPKIGDGQGTGMIAGDSGNILPVGVNKVSRSLKLKLSLWSNPIQRQQRRILANTGDS